MENYMLRGGIVGFGRMVLTHFSILNNHPEVEFVAVTDSSSFMLKNIGKHIDIETFKDYRKMIDQSDLDFVIVATPTGLHAEIVKYTINSYYLESDYCFDIIVGWMSYRLFSRFPRPMQILSAFCGWLVSFIPGCYGNTLTVMITPGTDLTPEPNSALRRVE